MFSLVLFCIKILRKIKKILIIVQRSNGDVFLSIGLIKAINVFYDSPQIDLLVNDDTFELAKLLPHINHIHKFSYKQKTKNRWAQEKKILFKIFRKYDLSVNLTSSDRSVLYAILSSKRSISVVEKGNKKSWWKKKLLSNFYFYDNTEHILIQNYTPLRLLGIKYDFLLHSIENRLKNIKNIQKKLDKKEIDNFIIFHPSAQYYYKILPNESRNRLLSKLSDLGISIIITGSKNKIDLGIKKELPVLNNVFDFIGDTTLEEYFALSELSLAYVGMDTLNMHIAAAQNKRIFAIFGPTKLAMWSPWSNKEKTGTTINTPIQTYGKNTIFQSSLPCEICGEVGCGNNHDKSTFNFDIDSDKIFNEVSNWYKNVRL